MSATNPLGIATALPRLGTLLRCLGAALLFGMSAAIVAAQPGGAIVKGRVSNAITGQYLNNARVTAIGTGKIVFTNSYGEYRVAGLPAGDVTLHIYYTGLDSKTITVAVGAGQVASQNVALGDSSLTGDTDDDTIELSEFIVQATEQANDAVAINEQRFSANIKNVVSADAFGDVTEGNPGEFLKYLPGVSVDYVAADVRSVSVRGFGSAFTSVNVDGNRMASAASSGTSRSFELEQVSMNNVARLEVVKVPLPSMPADSLGGSVNMISKNAFERDHAEFKYRVYTSVSDENLSLSESPGPGVEMSRKIRPGFDFSYTNPLSSSFGFILNGLYSNQFNEQHRTRTDWNGQASRGASPSAPYLRQYTFQDGPKETKRQSVGVNADWKVSENGVVSFGYQWNDYRSFFGNRNWNFAVGDRPAEYSPDHVISRTGQGEINHGMSHRHKYGTTNHGSLDYKFYRDTLEFNAGGYYSHATNHYDDVSEGAFSGVTIRTRPRITLEMAGFNGTDKPDTIIARDSAGNAIDWSDLNNYRIDEVRSNENDSWDEFIGLHLDVTKKFDKFAVKVGVDSRDQQRDLIRRNDDYEFLGADGVQYSDDDSPAAFIDEIYSGTDPHFGFGSGSVNYVDPGKVYQYFLANPGHFEAQTANWSDRVKNDYNISEKVEAAYIQGDWDLMDGKLKFITGLRWEKTSIDGTGYLYLPNGDREGARPEGALLSNDRYTRERLKWLRRAQTTSTSYDGTYPSAHLVYHLGESTIMRFAFAQTIGRPDFSNILPGTEVTYPEENAQDGSTGRVVVRNPGLKPYQGDNFDLSLERYFGQNGVISVGIFQKNITDFFGSLVKQVEQSDIALYNLNADTLGFDLSTRFNAGDATIKGAEFNYMQQLDMLPGIWSNLSVFANGTKLKLDGNKNADWRGFIEESANWGVSWSGKKFGAKIKWNYRGEQFRSNQSADNYGENAIQTYKARLYLDLNFDYRFNQHLTVFLNARNALNEPQIEQRYGDGRPAYARDFQLEEFAVQYAIGVKGTF